LDYQTKISLLTKDHPDLTLNYQSQLFNISRSHFYYQPVPASPDDIRLMELIDKIFTDYPFYGSRRITEELKQNHNELANRKRIVRLMQTMGLEAIYPKKRTTIPNQSHFKYPYLLRNLPITQPNQVWGTDITYIKLIKGFCYLVAILDWHSRYVIAWAIAETLDINFCLDNLQTALNINTPKIHNSDQGSHFTSPQYTNILLNKNINISMDGRGRCMDNIFTERLWRTVKYENVYLHDYQTHSQAKQGLTEYFNFYNNKRLHQSLGYLTPAQIYFQK
jgi:putative transposase